MTSPHTRAFFHDSLVSSKIWLVLILSITCLTYINIFQNTFLFDDLPAITENKATAPPLDLRDIFLTPSWWTEHESDSMRGYRPVTTLSFALNRLISGLNPFGFHAANLLIHLANCVLIFVLLSRLVGSIPLAGLTAVLFGVHPLHTEVVAGIVTRADGLAALFVLLALWAYIQAWTRPSPHSKTILILLSLILFGAGLGSKESAVCLIPLLIVYELCLSLPSKERTTPIAPFLLRRSAVIVLFVIVGLVYIFWWRPMVTGQFGDLAIASGASPAGLLHNRPLIWRITAFKAFAIYVKLLVWPVKLSGDYLFNQVPLAKSFSDTQALLGACLFAGGLLASLILAIKKKWALAFGLLFVYAAYLPVSNLLIPIGVLVGERLMYLPSLGFCLLLACLILFLLNRASGLKPFGPPAVVFLAVALISAYSLRSYARNADWKNPYIFFEKTAQTSPSSAVAHYSAAVAAMKMVEDQRYIHEWLNDSHIQAFKKNNSTVSAALAQKGLTHIQKAIRITKDQPRADYFSVYGSLLAMIGQLDKAYAVLEKTVRLDPHMAGARLNLGVVCLKLASRAKQSGSVGNTDYLNKALSHLEFFQANQARMTMEPIKWVQVHFNLAIVQQKAGKLDSAERNINQSLNWLDKAVSQTGKGSFMYGRLYMIQASILAEQHKIAQSLASLEKAKESQFPYFKRYAKNMKSFRVLKDEPQYRKLLGHP